MRKKIAKSGDDLQQQQETFEAWKKECIDDNGYFRQMLQIENERSLGKRDQAKDVADSYSFLEEKFHALMTFKNDKDEFQSFVTLEDIMGITGFVQEDIERRQAESVGLVPSSYKNVAVYTFPSRHQTTYGASSSSRPSASHRHEEWQDNSSTSAYNASTHQHTPSYTRDMPEWHHGSWNQTENRPRSWRQAPEVTQWTPTQAWNNSNDPYLWESSGSGYGPADSNRRNPRSGQYPYRGTRGDVRYN